MSAGAVRVTAPTVCASAPGSIAVFDYCIAGLHTIRVILDQVVDIIVKIRERLPDVASVAVLLIQVLVRIEPGC